MKTKDSTEEKILQSAITVFSQKGFHATRMQDIADHAGTNKALLNYYFRSKKNLFNKAMSRIFEPAFEHFATILDQEGDIFDVITNFIRSHQAFIRENPEMPHLMAKEFGSQYLDVTQMLSPLFSDHLVRSELIQRFFRKINKAIDEGIIRPIDPLHLIVNIVSMDILIYVAKPLINGIFTQFIDDWDEFLKQHEEEVLTMVLHSLTPKDRLPEEKTYE